MPRGEGGVNVGDIYTNTELDLTYRVLELRDEGDETVATVETLDEGVETYRTVDEIDSMLQTGEVVESDVTADAFDDADASDTVPVKTDDRDYLKIAGIVAVALALAGVFVPVAGVVLKFAARFLVPVGIAVLSAYLLYRALS